MFHPNEIYRSRARQIRLVQLAHDAFPIRIRHPREDITPNTLHLCGGRYYYYAEYQTYVSVGKVIVELFGGPGPWPIWEQYRQLTDLLRVRQQLIQRVVDGIGDQ